MKKFLLFLAVSFATFSTAALAATETYQIDPVHSTIGFKVKHLFSKVTGRFADVKGTIAVDPDAPQNATVEAVIAVKSISTENAKRDGHLQSPDFFDVAKFAEMTFKSKSVKLLDKDSADITGDLTIHGVTKETVLHTKFLGKGQGPMGPVSGWEATTKINRKDFGLTWGKIIEGTAVVGDEVEIELEIEAALAK